MKKILVSLTLLFTSSSVFAVDATPLFSVYGGAGSWSTEVSGDLGDSETSVDELGLSDEDNGYFYVALEHPVPVLPNVRIEAVDITSDGDETLTRDFTYGDTTFTASTDVQTEIDMSFVDFILYYELAMFDFGITARQFDVELAAASTTTSQSESEKVDGVLPMLYLQTHIDLPGTGLYVTGNAQGVSADDKSVTDYRAAVGYGIELSILAELGLELGYRSFEIDLGNDEDFAGDMDFSGVYFGAAVKF